MEVSDIIQTKNMKYTTSCNKSIIPLQKQSVTGRSLNLQSYFWNEFPDIAKPGIEKLFNESLLESVNFERFDKDTAKITAVWDSSFGKIESFNIGYSIKSKATGRVFEYEFSYPGTLTSYFEKHFPSKSV